jgi:NAD(P)-dependent dehydrogenase (short-subunit alcohol dehydrogenase family)
VDLTAVFWCLKHEVKIMLEDGGGAIVNTASGLGQIAIPNASEYVAAKHGVIGLTRAAAVEYGARGIRTNCLLPGIVNTPLIARLSQDSVFASGMNYMRGRHPIGRFAEPAEIGEAAMWLLSDAASFANGMAMAIDGGFLAG